MSTPTTAPNASNALPAVSSIAVRNAQTLQTLPTEILIKIIKNLDIWHQRCTRCNDVQAIWKCEMTFIHMALACDRFKDIMTKHGFLPDRAVKGNHLIDRFTCSCVSRRVSAVAPTAKAADQEGETEENIQELFAEVTRLTAAKANGITRGSMRRAANAAPKTRQPAPKKVVKSSSTRRGGRN